MTWDMFAEQRFADASRLMLPVVVKIARDRRNVMKFFIVLRPIPEFPFKDQFQLFADTVEQIIIDGRRMINQLPDHRPERRDPGTGGDKSDSIF